MRSCFSKILSLVVSASVLYAVIVAAVVHYASAYSNHKTEALVRYAAHDCVDTLDLLTDAALSHVAAALVENVRHPESRSVEEMQALAKMYGFGELNFVNRGGSIVSSSDPLAVGSSMITGPASEFMSLTNRGSRIVSQPFRKSVSNPDVVMKYLGMAFPEREGFVEVGMEVGYASRTFREVMPPMFKNWLIGETGYYLVVDANGIVISDTFEREDVVDRPVRDIGYAPPAKVDTLSSIYRQWLFGEPVTCFDCDYLGYRIVCVVPDREFLEPGRAMTVRVSAWLLVPFLLFGWLLWKNIRSGARLQETYAELARRNDEDLANARTIQISAMPTIFPAFPHDLRHDVFAQLDPARDVGGDFYDFFYISDSRFVILIADVSGKGVPAAMFMMKAKTMIKALVASMSDLAEAMTEANRRLCEGNEAGMFVTCWIGVVELTDGRLTYVNAGHNPPFVRRLLGKVERLDSVSGLFLAGLEDTVYTSYHCRLGKGDTVFLYTDGICEAENLKHDQFGEDRISRCLVASGSPQDLCRRVKLQADAFAGGAPQFDDMTTLAFVYRGRPQRDTVTLPAHIDNVGKASEFCENCLKGFGCQEEVLAKILISIDEIANNIVRHSGTDEFSLVCETADFPPMAQITFIDRGKPWNPLTHSDPDVTVPAEQREIGGLGIMIVKQLCDGVYYVLKEGRNEFTFRVSLPWRTLMARKIKGV